MNIEDEYDPPDDGGQYEAYYTQLAAERLRRGPWPPGLKITIASAEEGPRHDPYGLVTVTITTPAGKNVRLRDGALSGLRVWSGKDQVFSGPSTDGDKEKAEDVFLEHAGYSLLDVIGWYHDREETFEEIVEAERAAGWGPNP